jgi:uncharacterized protein with GYD domain
MPKFALMGGYTAEAWKAMIENPADRTGPVRKLCESVGARLDSVYWSFGEDDFLVIVEAPDDLTVAAASVAAASSGSLRNTRTVRLISQQEGQELLKKAKAAAGSYSKPGSREAVGVR